MRNCASEVWCCAPSRNDAQYHGLHFQSDSQDEALLPPGIFDPIRLGLRTRREKPNHTKRRSTSRVRLVLGPHIWQSARKTRYDTGVLNPKFARSCSALFLANFGFE